MKKIFSILTLAATLLLLGACFKDLDRFPRNESDFTPDRAYGNTADNYACGLAKIYGSFSLTGQDGPDNSEISVANAGASELTRQWWDIQELTTDSGKVAWGDDPWTREINTNTWGTANNDALAAVYERTILAVSLVNEFLRETTDELLTKRGASDEVKRTVARYRAEARFVRAYAWWMQMDAFGNPPFVTEADKFGDFLPPQIQRADLYKWIENELLDLTKNADMRAIGTATMPQVDKGAVWGLLARIRLNAKVYSGTAQWAEAASAAEEVIKGPYKLADNYAELFMGDNSENPRANKELMYVIGYDYEHTQSWGGTTLLISASVAGGDLDANINGASEGWGGIRTTYEYAKKFGVTDPDYESGTFTCPDKRAMFYIKGRKEEMNSMWDFLQGWSVIKYCRYPSTNRNLILPGKHSSTDFPMMRLAEMYLIYAEAKLAGSDAPGSDATALGYLNALRVRAGLAGDLTSYDMAYIRDERARELMWEAHRRTDLVRWGLYTGDRYLWPWKGGVKAGRALEDYYNLCPLLQDDVNQNGNLKQNPGYVK